MNDFEASSLKIAADAVQVSKDALSLSTWGLAISASSLLLAAVAAWVGYRGLRHIAGQFTVGQLNALLMIEQDMNQRRQRFSEIDAEIRANGGTTTPDIERKFAEARESYLNSLERLASCILQSKFDENEMRLDYREYFAELIRIMPDSFNAGTRFRKIKKLHERWADT